MNALLHLHEQKNALQEFRQEIDSLDAELIQIIAKRMQVVKKIGKYKKKYNINTVQPNRWQEIVDSRRQQAQQLDLDETHIVEIFEVIHQLAIQTQQKD